MLTMESIDVSLFVLKLLHNPRRIDKSTEGGRSSDTAHANMLTTTKGAVSFHQPPPSLTSYYRSVVDGIIPANLRNANDYVRDQHQRTWIRAATVSIWGHVVDC